MAPDTEKLTQRGPDPTVGNNELTVQRTRSCHVFARSPNVFANLVLSSAEFAGRLAQAEYSREEIGIRDGRRPVKRIC